jgi:hypothetical protein
VYINIPSTEAEASSSSSSSLALKKLSFYNATFSDRDVKAMVSALKAGALQTLIGLDCTGEKVTKAGALSLAAAMRAGLLPNLTYLRLQRYKIGGKGAGAIAAAALMHCPRCVS